MKEKTRKRKLKELGRRIQSEIEEYNEKYGVMPYLPEAVRLKNTIERHKEKYYQIKSELRSKKNG